jgi:prepilin-type N-terminal cleavage/methylation domain-containing protein
MYKCNKNSYAFTLVELIVVITILAVLSTIAFISFQGYTVNARDSVRLADMNNISKGFNIKITTAIKLPVPDDKIDITASGTILTYQGYAGQQVLGNIEVH